MSRVDENLPLLHAVAKEGVAPDQDTDADDEDDSDEVEPAVVADESQAR
eukprot:gene21237-52104_t